MAVYRKKLVDKDGNTIIPAVGDIYGTVYTATLSSATAGGRADYEFTPDTPVENNKVYAVMFPEPTVNNATIILGDGVVSGSILVPPVSATDSPNYELLTTDMINNTEPLLLMYNGVQWVCLNQKKKVATADLEDNAVTSAKVDWATLPGNYSTTEKATPYKWINGKTIYKKTIAYNTTGDKDFTISTGISNGEDLVKFESSMKSTIDVKSKYGGLPIIFADIDWKIGIRSIANNLSSIRVTSNNQNLVNSMILYITMFYTKTSG